MINGTGKTTPPPQPKLVEKPVLPEAEGSEPIANGR
jgi:hypothetical protein